MASDPRAARSSIQVRPRREPRQYRIVIAGWFRFAGAGVAVDVGDMRRRSESQCRADLNMIQCLRSAAMPTVVALSGRKILQQIMEQLSLLHI